jgi:hypothetical protein
MSKTVMLFGLGAVGEVALQILARMDGIDRIVATGRNEVLGTFKMKTAALGATYQQFSKKYEFFQNDASDIDATARLLEKIKPDVILLVASLKSPQVLGTSPMPAEARANFRAAGFGVQLPWQLLIPFKFMQALEKSGIDTTVINGSFPDVTGPALWNHFGFGPTMGMGNVDLTAAEIIRYVSDQENVPTHEVMLSLVSSHAFLVHGTRQEVPYFAKILLGDRDITDKYSVKSAVRAHGLGKATSADIQAATSYFNFVTASSAVRNIMAIVNNTNEYTHAPSPNGLIGGYPVRLGSKGAKVILPSDLSLEEAIEINKAAEKFDGIENIKDDGTVVFTDKTYSLMKELGYDCRELTFDELESRGRELTALIEKLQAQVK